MSSTTPTIDSKPAKWHPEQPRRFPIVPSGLLSTDYSLISDNTPGDAPPIPTRSHHHKPPERSSVPHAVFLPPKAVASTGKHALHDTTRIPRASSAHLLPGLKVRPKVYRRPNSFLRHLQTKPKAPQVSDDSLDRQYGLLEEARQADGYDDAIIGGAGSYSSLRSCETCSLYQKA